MAEIVQSADTQTEWQTGTLDGVEATNGGDLVLAAVYALSFDGVDDYVSVPLGTIPLANDTKTIFYRVKGISSEKYFAALSTRFDVNDLAGFFHGIDQRDGGRIFYIHTGNGAYTTSPDLYIGTEYCVAVTTQDNGSNVKIYLDGVLLSPTANDISIADAENTSGDFVIGRQSTAFANGYIRDVRIWNIELTQQQIQDNMNSQLTGTETGLVAYYPMTAGSGTTLTDHAGTNDGTINGATWTGGYSETGTRTAPTLDLSTLGTASENSTISWQATDNSQTIAIETSLSTDGGTTWGAWQAATNGGSIPGITTGMDLSTAQLKCRQTLSTTDTAVTPQLHSITVTVREQAILSGIIAEAGAPVARTVRAYRRDTGEMVGETTSASADGTFSMDVGVEVECYVVTLDDTSDATDYNAEIADRVTPGT